MSSTEARRFLGTQIPRQPLLIIIIIFFIIIIIVIIIIIIIIIIITSHTGKSNDYNYFTLY